MTYNIRHGQGEGGWISNSRIARVVREADVDLVGMNEVWRLGRFFDQPANLAARLSLERAFRPNLGFAPFEQGNLVLARGAIRHVENLELPSQGERRACLLVRVEIAGEEIAFGSVHLALSRKMRARQIDSLAEKLPRNVPLVLAGDMNCLAQELRPLDELLTFADAPPSYPAFWPVRALDHIGYSSHWRLEGVSAIRIRASDHLPVIVELVRI